MKKDLPFLEETPLDASSGPTEDTAPAKENITDAASAGTNIDNEGEWTRPPGPAINVRAMDMSQPSPFEPTTSEWPALHAVWKEKMEIIKSREQEHRQHVIEHGAPRVGADYYLAALCQMKANRVWNNLIRGGHPDALYDSVIDLGNYADFLAAYLKERK